MSTADLRLILPSAQADGTVELGSVSDWVGALLTSLSLLLAVVILWRDQQYKRREQIDHVGWWFGFESGKWGWHVTNASNLPIRVWMQIVRTDGKLFTMIGGSGEQEQVITSASPGRLCPGT